MELLIPGLLLVALMVYVSTRIKRTAADAYEAEGVETADLSITKPEGFIIIDGDDPSVLFSAYSREYGTDEADAVRQVSATIVRHADKNIGQVRDAILQNEDREKRDGEHSNEFRTDSDIGGVVIENEYRLLEKDGKTFELRVSALAETREENQGSIDELISSFRLK